MSTVWSATRTGGIAGGRFFTNAFRVRPGSLPTYVLPGIICSLGGMPYVLRLATVRERPGDLGDGSERILGDGHIPKRDRMILLLIRD